MYGQDTRPPTHVTERLSLERISLLTQAAYYLASGIWPLLSMRSFERVTGPKTDKWLVKTVGVLVAAIGAPLLLGAKRKAISPEVRLLAAGSSSALALIDVTYVAKRRISRVYLLDAIAEVTLLSLFASGTALLRNGETNDGSDRLECHGHGTRES